MIDALSCASARSCSGGGQYLAATADTEVFVVTEKKGTWGKSKEMPGIAALNGEGFAKFNTISCPSPGNCAAGGSAIPSTGPPQAYVVNEANGTWGTAEEVPGIAAINTGPDGAGVFSVSCVSAGNCSAGGDYADQSLVEAFVVGETNGTWGTAEEVPGIAALNQGGFAQVTSVSCASLGHCTAGGFYVNGSHRDRPFVVTEKNGTWGTAKKVPGIATLNTMGAQISSLSCALPGNCAAGGYYIDDSGSEQAFVVDETNGTWGSAEEVPGTAALNGGGHAQISSVSCGAAGACAAGGYYTDDSGSQQAFVVDETG